MVMKYNIYGILYNSPDRGVANAVVSAESIEEAEGMLEKTIVEELGYESMVGHLNPETFETKFKTNKKGIISGYDSLSGQNLMQI
jgi:hypothetical protein